MDVVKNAARRGIETSFVDAIGQHRTASPDVIALIASSLPDRPASRIFSAPVICRSDLSAAQDLAESAELPINWKITDLNGRQRAEGMSRDRRLSLPVLPVGIYRIRARDGVGEEEISFLSTPARAFSGKFDRAWIVAVQLYGLRSRHNWGIGDFSDLKALIAWAAQRGAAGVGLNPLHALFEDRPNDCSPYSPNCRLFLNPLYLDVTQLPELSETFAGEHAEQIDMVRSAELVDYEGVARLKLEALRQAFSAFQSKATLRRRTSFEAYRQNRSEVLSRFACFETLRRRYLGPWWTWPDGWSTPDDASLNELRNGPDAAAIELVEFIQWNADLQLGECRDLADQLELPIGLYLDIAVGVKADGFDAWNEQSAISRKLAVGAPPDLLNTAGQNWGLAGFNAAGLEARSYKPFEDLLNASMRYAGAVRLDHVLGLKRLYLIPEGYPPDQGAYVEMPLEALLAVTALTSVKNKCVVIGEDLGTVPGGFRERLENWGIWSYRVMIFERDHDGSFHPTEYYPQDALVTFNTHDLPTFLGWSSAYDISLKRSLGIDPGENQDGRLHAVKMFAEALHKVELQEANFYSAINYLARTKSRILGLSIEDLLGVQEQPNVPGTIDEHPNWRRRLPVNIEAWEGVIDTSLLRNALNHRCVVTAPEISAADPPS